MPYIKKELRPNLDVAIDALIVKIRDTTSGNDELIGGVLNYCITRIILGTIIRRCGTVRYNIMCTIEGVLSHVAKEIYRRITGPYEDQKIKESGDLQEFVEIDQRLFPGDYR